MTASFVVDCWRPPPPDRLSRRDNAPPVRSIVGPFATHDEAQRWLSVHSDDWSRLVVFELKGPGDGEPKSALVEEWRLQHDGNGKRQGGG